MSSATPYYGNPITPTATLGSINISSNSGQYLTANGVWANPQWTNGNVISGQFAATNITTLFSLYGNAGECIVSMDKNGVVSWHDDIKLDEAAEAFTKALHYSAEVKAGITQQVKYSIRDQVFGELIAMAQKTGSLTVADLEQILEASKIIEKLKA